MVDLVISQQYLAGNAADASAAMQAVFGVGSAEVESLGSLRYEQRSLVDDGISATRISSSGALLDVRAAPAPDMVVIAVRSGYLLLQQGDHDVALQAGDLGLIPLEQSAHLRWEEVVMDLYSFPRSSLQHLLGTDQTHLALRIARTKAASPDVMALWRRNASLLGNDVLQTEELFESDLVREQAINSLLGLTIEAFGISDAKDDPDADATRVQAATAYLLQHLSEPISITEVARAIGASVRGLQLAYRRTGTGTPLAHLRALRMTAARSMLDGAAAQPAITVRDAAARTGYTNIGRFEAHYLQASGETAQETLQHAGR